MTINGDGDDDGIDNSYKDSQPQVTPVSPAPALSHLHLAPVTLLKKITGQIS